MLSFLPSDLQEIDRLWRALPADHVWSGWAASGEAPEHVWIFRTRANWRRLPLIKTVAGFALSDERGQRVVTARTLEDLLRTIEAIPGLAEPPQD